MAASGRTQQQPAPQVGGRSGPALNGGCTLQRRARFCSVTSATSLTRYNASHLRVSSHRFVRIRHMARTQTETENDTSAVGCSAARGHDPSASSQVSGGGGCEIRTREGLPPTRFPTLLHGVHRRPPPSANCANTIRVDAGERSRTGMNEPKTEPRPGAKACCPSVAGESLDGVALHA